MKYIIEIKGSHNITYWL